MNRNKNSIYQLDSPRFNFDVPNNTLCHFEQNVKRWNDRKARQNSGTVEGYINRRCEIVLRFAIGSEQLDFILRAIPVGI